MAFVGTFANSEGRYTLVSWAAAAVRNGPAVSVHLRAADPEGACAAASTLFARSADPEGASAAAGKPLEEWWGLVIHAWLRSQVQ